MDIAKICVEKLAVPIVKVVSAATSKSHAEKLAAAFLIKKIWPSGSKIKICFIQDPPLTLPRTSVADIESRSKGRTIDPLQYVVDGMSIKEAIVKIVHERIISLVGLDVSFTDTQAESNVRISFDPSGGSYSSVGTDCLLVGTHEATTNFGWFDVSTVIHELCHAVGGMIHEHQNPRGKTIDWNIPKVEEYMKETQGWDDKETQINVLDRYTLDTTNGSDFDPDSVMLYFYPADLTLDNTGTSENNTLSLTDMIWLSKIYPGGQKPYSEMYKEIYGVQIRKSLNWAVIALVVGIIIIIVLVYIIYRRRNYK